MGKSHKMLLYLEQKKYDITFFYLYSIHYPEKKKKNFYLIY